MTHRFHIDAPVQNPGTPVFAPAIVAGWFLDDQLCGAAQVRVRAGTHTLICEQVTRPDVVAAFTSPSPPNNKVGFHLRLPADTSSCILTIEAETVSGEIITLGQPSLVVSHWPPRLKGLRNWFAARKRAKTWARPVGPADTVLVLIPVKPGTDPSVISHARKLAERALAQLPAYSTSRIVFDDRGHARPRTEHAWRIAAMAEIRQGMIASHLRDERWVFWPDIDLINYPHDLVSNLIRRAEGGIAAPMIFMDNAASCFGGPLFYDVAGFVEDGQWAMPHPPYFKQPGPVYNLESVGSCYLVPADLYRRGARHAEDPGSRLWINSRGESSHQTELRDWENRAYTEHYSVCAFARQHGLPVRAFSDLIAIHEYIG